MTSLKLLNAVAVRMRRTVVSLTKQSKRCTSRRAMSKMNRMDQNLAKPQRSKQKLPNLDYSRWKTRQQNIEEMWAAPSESQHASARERGRGKSSDGSKRNGWTIWRSAE